MIDSHRSRSGEHAIVLLDEGNGRRPMGLIGTDDSPAITGLVRTLSHYSSDAVLASSGPDADNVPKPYLSVRVPPMPGQPDE